MSEEMNTPDPVEEESTPQPEELVPATPAQIEKAEGLLRQARIAKMRNDMVGADSLLKEAEAAAPTSAAVLTAIGDDLVERGQKARAIDIYRKAFQVDPKAVDAERKYAELILEAKAFADPFFNGMVNDSSTYANGKVAILLSMIPGAGQFALGHTTKGVVFLVAFVAPLLFIMLIPGAFSGMWGLIGVRGAASFNPVVIPPMFISTLAFLWSLFDATAEAKRLKPIRVERPVPPVNKDF